MSDKQKPPYRAYLLAFDQEIDRESMSNAISRSKAFSAWVVYGDNAAVLSSRKTAFDLSAALRKLLPGKWFVLTEVVKDNCDGLAPTTIWALVDNPDEPWTG